MIVDSHQHFIQFNTREYPWIGEHMTLLRQDLMPDDLAAAARPVGVDAAVAVEARQTVEETRWLIDLARHNALVAGVVGWVDLRDPRVEEVLDELAPEPLLVGVCHVIHDEPGNEFMLRSDFCRGIGTLKRFGLTYDILIFSRHLPQTLEFVRRFPDQPFVIDHIAKPRIRDGEFGEWRDRLKPVAACENVFCKVSGMVTEARPRLWKPDDFKRYVDVVLDLFGPNRVMFGSDWPVCTLEAPYSEVFEIVDDATAELSGAEREMVLGGTAATFYGIETRQID